MCHVAPPFHDGKSYTLYVILFVHYEGKTPAAKRTGAVFSQKNYMPPCQQLAQLQQL
ncbi:hypothetical protein P4284_18380 [Bacillus swezeyi]|uniref:hypothetical protein n=1 Tax=Bacillus swezeyi TaxID=1925020 RepID=UPI002E1EAC67|nr:hypothetical protein [Bacillus swezeyi]